MVSSKPTPGVNDLQSQFPEVAKEWHPTKNGNLKSTDVRKASRKKTWWQCSKYPVHEWIAKVADRSNGIGCPICANKKVLEGFNDLQKIEPELAKEWHPTKNKPLKPTEVTRSSNKKVWWQCIQYSDHEWDAKIADRTNGKGCPICSGSQVLEGFNDLQKIEPELAKEWHPTKNKPLKPTEVTSRSKQKVWWQCSSCKHEWAAAIGSRSQAGRGCPTCAEHGFNPGKDAWFYLMQRPGEQQLGITNELDVRMKTHERNGWVLLEYTVPASGQIIFDTEKAFKKWLKKEIGLMEGTTENWSTTKMEVQSLAELKARSGIETDLF